MPLVAEDASWRERVILDDRQRGWPAELYIRLCGKARYWPTATRTSKRPTLLTMTMWHAETVAIVEQGLACGEFHSTEPPGYRLAFYRPGVRPRRDLRPRHPDPGRDGV